MADAENDRAEASSVKSSGSISRESSSSDGRSYQMLILNKGNLLNEESETEYETGLMRHSENNSAKQNWMSMDTPRESRTRNLSMKSRKDNSGNIEYKRCDTCRDNVEWTSWCFSKTLDKFETEAEFKIPNDGNLYAFDVNRMNLFFTCFNVNPNLLERLKEKNVDGKRFSRFTDDDLERMGLRNSVICHFRNKSKKRNMTFML